MDLGNVGRLEFLKKRVERLDGLVDHYDGLRTRAMRRMRRAESADFREAFACQAEVLTGLVQRAVKARDKGLRYLNAHRARMWRPDRAALLDAAHAALGDDVAGVTS